MTDDDRDYQIMRNMQMFLLEQRETLPEPLRMRHAGLYWEFVALARKYIAPQLDHSVPT